MKILYIINTLETGGAEKMIIDSLSLLVKKGFDVKLLVLKKTSSQFERKLLMNKNFDIHFLSNKSVYSPLLVFKIPRYFKKYSFIHAHLFPTLYWVVLAKKISFSKIKIIYTEHSTSNRRRHHKIFKLIDRFFYNNIYKIVCITKAVQDNLKVHLGKIDSMSIQVIENGVNLDDFKAGTFFDSPKLKIHPDDFTIIQIASFRDAKDQATVIRALQLLPRNFKVIFVGDGPNVQYCKNLAKDLNVSKSITFLGVQTNIPGLIALSDVVVVSSKYEGFGIVAVEGMASGKPVISTNVAGLAEIVNGAGVLFEVGDFTELKQILLLLNNDLEYYNEIKSSCLKRAQKFSINKNLESYSKLYEKAMI